MLLLKCNFILHDEVIDLKVIAGLGNPGLEYAATRHNAGFMALDFLAGQLEGVSWCSNFQALCSVTFYGSEKLLLLKPQTYMNLSGLAVAKAVRFYQIDWSDVLVIYDDMDLTPGLVRLRQRGSSGGHKGMQSIIENAGTDAISRIKIGIGHGFTAQNHVLQHLDPAELKNLLDSARIAAEAALCWTKFGVNKAMNEYNRVKPNINEAEE